MVGEVAVARFAAESSREEEEGTANWPEAAEHMVAVVPEDTGNHQAVAAVGGRKADKTSSRAAAAAVHIAAADRRLEDTPAGEGQRAEDTLAEEGQRLEDMPAAEERRPEDTLAAEGQHQEGSSLPAEDMVPRTEAAHKEVDARTAVKAVAAPDTARIGAEGAAGSRKNRDSEGTPAARTLVSGAAVAVECWVEMAEVVGAGHMPSHEGAAEAGSEEGAEAGDEEGEGDAEVGEAAEAEAAEGEHSV